MKLQVEYKVRWWLVGVVAGTFIIGTAFGLLYQYAQPTFVRCSFTLPDTFQIPSES